MCREPFRKEISQKTLCLSENVKEPRVLVRHLAQIKKLNGIKMIKSSHTIPAGIPVVLIALVSISGTIYLGKSALDSSGLIEIQAPNGFSVTVDAILLG
jgi:hypothetical protein